MKTLYEVLGIPHIADSDDIKKAFRRKSREHHPDLNPDKENSRDFRLCYYAYTVLRDPQLRGRYDKKLLGIGQDMLTLYDILEIHNSASLKDVKKSFKKLAFLFHPDITGDSRTADHFRMIYYASNVLSDDKTRDRYDQKIAQFGLL